MKKQIGIIGFGRFGQAWASLLHEDFIISVFDPTNKTDIEGVHRVDFDTIVSLDTLFLCVPIRHFKSLIESIAPKLNPNTTIIDMCSVKLYPTQIMEELLPESVGIIASHPLFGPDSMKSPHPLKMMMHPIRDTHDQFPFWEDYLGKKHIELSNITPDEHDRLAARSQGVTHYIGRVLEAADIHETPIDTLGFTKLLSIKKQTCNDTWELFRDLQHYNPHSKAIAESLMSAIKKVIKEC